MGPPSTIPIHFNYEKQSDHSLFKLWKLTNDLSYIKCPDISTTERLNNRSWRLLNQRVLMCCQHLHGDTSRGFTSLDNRDSKSNCTDELNDLFKENLKDLKPKTTQFLAERPTLFSHSSNFSLQHRKQSTQTSLESFALEKQDKQSLSGGNVDHIHEEQHILESDMSDISEISDDDDDDDDDKDDEYEEEEEEEEAEGERKQPQHKLHDEKSSQNDRKACSSPKHFMQISSNKSLQPHSASSHQSDRVSPLSVHHNQSDTFFLGSSSSSSNRHDHFPKSQSSTSDRKASPLHQIDPKSHTENGASSTLSAPTDSERTQDPLQQPGVQRQNSLFNNFNFQDNSLEILNGSRKTSNQTVDEIDLRQNKGYCSSTDISEDEASADEVGDEGEDEDEGGDDKLEEKGCIEQDKQNKTTVAQSQVSSHNVSVDFNSTRKNSSATTSNKDDNDSEWVSVYSSSINSTAASSKSVPKNQSLNFTKVEPPSSVLSSETISSMDNKRRNSNSTPILNKPKSLLSGLFLNEMVHSQSSTPVPVTDKPKLLRSTTTGVLTIDEENKRPSLLFTRKFPSYSDIPPLGRRVQSPASTATNRTNSSSSASESLVAVDVNNSFDSNATPLKKQGSSVGISDINVSKVPTAKTTVDEEHELLSHSLNKFSRSVSHHSLINLLSKSSINLSRIYINSMTKLKSESNHHNRNYSGNLKLFDSPQSKASADSDKSGSGGNGQVSPIIQPKPAVLEAEHTRKHSPSSLTSTSEILLNSSKALATPPASAPAPAPAPALPKITTTDTALENNKKEDANAGAIPINALSAEEKELMENNELSSSLREALLIDHKLGRVAMPDGVMVKKSIVGGESVDEGVFDDYHAKGW
ncbi:hypothetical protein KGF57_005256 [Candida theae]|uniref:Nitrogen regulatory protein areA GATA-like domain-containing protein n=1 Tax=Candida theae TaxID=1198502 RepID=A0AAD5B9J3_9ASCO|nr:uncharacterized protein KGF57_005256 [Candida theae]KAI5948858.1 hypothetical protein KGF57_005256 [Candida theae]